VCQMCTRNGLCVVRAFESLLRFAAGARRPHRCTRAVQRSVLLCPCPRGQPPRLLLVRCKPQSRTRCGAVRTDVDGWLAAMPHPHAHLATREHSRRCLGCYYLCAGAARSSNGERSVATDVVAVRAETGAFEERMEQIRARLRSEGRDFEAKLNQVRRTCGFST
jgi:hypothetical protein